MLFRRNRAHTHTRIRRVSESGVLSKHGSFLISSFLLSCVGYWCGKGPTTYTNTDKLIFRVILWSKYKILDGNCHLFFIDKLFDCVLSERWKCQTSENSHSMLYFLSNEETRFSNHLDYDLCILYIRMLLHWTNLSVIMANMSAHFDRKSNGKNVTYKSFCLLRNFICKDSLMFLRSLKKTSETFISKKKKCS